MHSQGKQKASGRAPKGHTRKRRLLCVAARGTVRGEKGRALQEALRNYHPSVLPTTREVSAPILSSQAGKLRLEYNLPKVVSFQRMRIRFPSSSMSFPALFSPLVQKGKLALGGKIRGRRQRVNRRKNCGRSYQCLPQPPPHTLAPDRRTWRDRGWTPCPPPELYVCFVLQSLPGDQTEASGQQGPQDHQHLPATSTLPLATASASWALLLENLCGA